MYSRKSLHKYNHSLSTRESKILSNLSYKGKTIITPEDIKEFVLKPENVLDNLTKKKWVLKIKKGIYAITPLETGEEGARNYTLHDFVIASLLVQPYYIGYWSALNHHGLTEQTPSSVYIATTKRRVSRKILNNKFKFVFINNKKMFGIDETEIEGRVIRISSPEKTIVDCLDHPEYCGGTEEVAKVIYFSKNEIDFKKVVDFAKRINNSAAIKRLGYISELFNLSKCSELLSSVTIKQGWSLLDPLLPKKGKIKLRWKLQINLSLDPNKWVQ